PRSPSARSQTRRGRSRTRCGSTAAAVPPGALGQRSCPPHCGVLRLRGQRGAWPRDRKSTRLNSSHLVISYAVFCLKKKNTKNNKQQDRQRQEQQQLEPQIPPLCCVMTTK